MPLPSIARVTRRTSIATWDAAYRLGTTLCKSFGDHFSTSLEYQYARQAKEVYTHGGYTGSYHLYSARRNACSLSLKYKF